METRKIGSLDVSVVGLGTNNFGGRLDETATKSVIDAALASGINFVDTANTYGQTKSEEFIGRSLKGRRDLVVLATKFAMPVVDDGIEGSGAKPDYVRVALEASLRRLGTDYVDLYIQHRWDPDVPIADTLEALAGLVEAGKVREIGASNFTLEQLLESEAAVRDGAPRFVNLQNRYSVLQREPEDGVLAECVRQHIGFVPFSPLASGLLTGKFRRGGPLPEGTRIAQMPDERRNDTMSARNMDAVEALTEFAESKGHTLLELAFSWLLAQPSVTSVIAGATSPAQIAANVAAAGWAFTPEDLAEVDRITKSA